MELKPISITHEVKISHAHHFLVRIDQTIVGYCEDEKTAMSIVNSIAATEVKNNEKDNIKVFRRDLRDGREVQICTQVLGSVWNGSVRKACVIDYIPIALASYVETQ